MAVVSAEEFDELKLDEVIAQGSLDFEDWTKLISYVEQINHDDIEKITMVYDSFLSEFPLCYGYWKKYAEHNVRLCNVEKAVQIFERAVESVPYSVGVWVDYCGFSVSSFEDPMEICRLFERGLSLVGKDYLCHILWDKYIEYEFSQQHWNSLANIYIRTLKFPTKKLHHYYESFKKLVTIWEEEMGYQSNTSIEEQAQHEMDSGIKASKDTEVSRVISDLLDPFARSKALKKYISLGEQFYRIACDLDAKVQKFEQHIRRSYFHVKPLDDDQLQNWHQYLDLVEMEGDFDWAVKLYERCVIACANYPEFWMRYVDYVESKGGKEIATDALERATNSILKNATEIHLFKAWYKEKEGDVGGVHAAFLHCDQDSDSLFVDIIRRKANMEKRLGNHVAASDIYKEALGLAAGKRPHTLPMLYLHFARLQYAVSNGVEAARQILLDGIEHVPLSKLLLKELILFALMHEEAIKVEVLDSIVEKAMTITSDISSGLSTQDREELSRLYLEFTDYQGTIHDVWRAWNRHLKLFPHLVRQQPSFKKPVNARGLWKLFPRPQNPIRDDSDNRLIQLPSEEEKLLMGEKIDQSEQAIHVQAKLEDVNGGWNELEVGALEATKKAECGAIDSTDQAADDRMDVVKDSTSNGIQQEKPPSMDDESQNIIASPASVHDILGNPSISHAVSPRDDNTTERFNESSGPSAKPSHKNSLPDISTDRPSDRDWKRHRLNPPPGKGRLESGSPRNSEERLERSSLSPKRRGGSREYFHDRRYREQSLSPRRYGGRRFSEDRWHRGERHDRRYYNQRHHQDNNYSRGRRDIRSQNQNQNQSQAIAVQTSNAQQQIASQQAAQLPIQPIAFPQAQVQMNQYPPPSNEQYGNMQSNPLYNQMWQYYYYNQQQQLLLQQQQQPAQQQQVPAQQPAQQLMQNTTQNPTEQGQAQQISPNNQEQQQLLLQYQQFYQQQLLQQQQPTEQPPAQQQQVQVPAQQPQVQSEGVNVQQQQQAYDYQELQKQQYLLYLQQLQLYQQQHSQQSGGLPQDQHSLQQQQLPGVGVGQQDEQANVQHGDEKSQHQQDDGSSQVSGHYLMGRGVESTHNSSSGADALTQHPDELPEIEGTDG